MNRIVRIGGPPPAESEPVIDQALTVVEGLMAVGILTLSGFCVYMVEGDPGGLIAAAVIFVLLFMANWADE